MLPPDIEGSYLCMGDVMIKGLQVILTLGAILLLLLAVLALLSPKMRESVRKIVHTYLQLTRYTRNPILLPRGGSYWESEAVFNPAALYEDGRLRLLYRAVGPDGVSRFGYASSGNGFNFNERLPHPVFTSIAPRSIAPSEKKYSPVLYPSGGSWGGAEDPRMVVIDGRVYVTFNAFDGWDYLRVGVMSLSLDDFLVKRWCWDGPIFVSPPGEIHKNWVLFPEKLHGKFAVLHSITPEVQIDYVTDLNDLADGTRTIRSRFEQKKNRNGWDMYVRSAGPPPIKNEYGWLVLYHAMEKNETSRYKLGAMLLDINEPTRVLHRAQAPILAPDAWYENDWKPGIVYSCGAIVKDNDLLVYYGGGDKTTCVAHAPLQEFLHALVTDAAPAL